MFYGVSTFFHFFNLVEQEPKNKDEHDLQETKPSLLATLFGSSAVIVGPQNVKGIYHIYNIQHNLILIIHFLYRSFQCILILCLFVSENTQNKENETAEDLDKPADFMFTLFIQQNEEVESSHSPKRKSSVAIIMQQNEV